MSDQPLNTRADLLAYLGGLGIDVVTREHRPAHTVADLMELADDLPGTHCKNLFLKDKKGQLWLAVLPAERDIDTKDLRRRIGAAHLSFGRPETLMEALGVQPGAVTPFAALNDPDGHVRVVVDASLMTAAVLNFHPLDNRATTAIAPADLRRFLDAAGHAPLVIDLDAELDAGMDGPPPEKV